MMGEAKKGVIFDLDGTLWDACDVIAAAYTAYMQEKLPQFAQGFSFSGEQSRKLCGVSMDEIGDAVFGAIPAGIRKDVLQDIWDYEVGYIRENGGGNVYTGVMQMLSQLIEDGYLLYIVSNCQNGYIETFLDWTGTRELFSDTECNGHTALMKADNIRLLAGRNHLDKAVYVGDTQGDLDSADEAGVLFIHAAYGFGNTDRSVPAVDSPDELPEMVRRVMEE